MKLNNLCAGLLCLLLVGCGNSGLVAGTTDVDVEIVNRSSHNLENTQVRFAGKVCAWGRLMKTATAIYLFFPNPITPQAEVEWDEPTGHRAEKLDLRKIYPLGKSGRLTFTVFDGRVDVGFRERTGAK